MFSFLRNRKICLILGLVLILGLGFGAGFLVGKKIGSMGKTSPATFEFETEHYKDDELRISFDYLKDFDLYDKTQLEQKKLKGLAGLEKKKTPHIYCLANRTEKSKSTTVPYKTLEDYIGKMLGSEVANLEIEPYEAENYSGAKALYELDTLEGGLLRREMIVFATPKYVYSLFCTSFASELKYFEKEFAIFFQSFKGN